MESSKSGLLNFCKGINRFWLAMELMQMLP